MRPDELLDVIGTADENYIADAKAARKAKERPEWVKWTALAACLALVLGGGFSLLRQMGFGGAGGGGGGGEGLTYMSYAGPVFPLSVQDDAGALSAEREIIFDFSPYDTVIEEYLPGEHDGETKTYRRYDDESIVTDRYILHNSGTRDVTTTALYAYVGSWDGEEKHIPTVTVDGEEVETVSHYGPYSGGFMGAWGGKDEATGSVNLRPLNSFAGYEELLADGSYLLSAFDEFPALDIPVTVYRWSDYVYTQDEEARVPHIEMEFYIDFDRTYVFSYGTEGATNNNETGYCSRNKCVEYRPNAAPRFRHPEDAYIILMGEDLESYTIQGYRDGSCEEGTELDDLTCTVTRYETTLDAVIREIVGEQAPERDTESYYGLLAELMLTHGPLSENGAERYDFGYLEDVFSAAANHSRVIYQTFEVTVPAGARVTVETRQIKDASMDFVGKNKNRNGYDMATTLGSELNFTAQFAALAGYEEIEILDQNFGFDPDNGVTRVSLDLNQNHYWLEIQKIYLDEEN